MQRQPVRGAGLDSWSQSATVRHGWRPGRTANIQFSYRYGENRQEAALGLNETFRTHAGEVMIRGERRLSATRNLSIGVGGGATYSTTEAYANTPAQDFVTPTIVGSFQVDLSRSWSVTLDARRDVTTLQGLTPVPFATNATTLGVRGNLSPRVQLSVTGAYSRGLSGIQGSGSFENLVTTSQVQYALGRRVGIFASYAFYSHRLNDIPLAQPAFPRRYEMNTVRVGTTIWLPVYGAF